MGGVKISWGGSKYRYDILTPGSIFRGVKISSHTGMMLADDSVVDADVIVMATGFRNNFDFVDVPCIKGGYYSLFWMANSLPPARSSCDFNFVISKLISRKISSAFLVKLLSGKCHMTPWMISQHWFRQGFRAVRQRAIIWTNVDQYKFKFRCTFITF